MTSFVVDGDKTRSPEKQPKARIDSKKLPPDEIRTWKYRAFAGSYLENTLLGFELWTSGFGNVRGVIFATATALNSIFESLDKISRLFQKFTLKINNFLTTFTRISKGGF